MSLLTLSQRCGTVENESCTDASFRRYDNVAKRFYVATTFSIGLLGPFTTDHSDYQNVRELQKC